MSYKSVLVLSDNEVILTEFIKIINDKPELSAGRSFKFACHPKHEHLVKKEILGYFIEPLDIKKDHKTVELHHDLVISAHCKQIFPEELIKNLKCINIHPGYNPYNRGWYPQVFSILNGKPLGATVHEIDAQLDHGPIIAQEETELHSWDTSLSAYNRVQNLEIKLLKKYLPTILENSYEVTAPKEEGNVNLKKDFEALTEIKLDETVTFKIAIDRLRALSHPPFKNAFFIDPLTGKRIWLEVILSEDNNYD